MQTWIVMGVAYPRQPVEFNGIYYGLE